MLPRRLHHLIARLALAWFALALGVAAASPLVQPRAMQLVCSAEGGVKLMLVQPGEGGVDVGAHPWRRRCVADQAPPPAPRALADSFCKKSNPGMNLPKSNALASLMAAPF